ncbi:golgin candidate 6 [Selaginella moellendorffii]|uniref:golgin candidate 6 n=1 Tax=Selaginella moellendorffii TaxID=88036 RepID=UPI000D1CD8E4|nr:golgin candidate 6 [Selaginella moellendorffii]|eukprot:XP_024530596.1 golgin candidate 6 [Selaginella moellendorffii]
MRPSTALGMMVKGVGGFVFGSGDHPPEDDGGVEQLLETISNGTLAVDRRAAMEELRVLVDENRQAQLAFGAMGFPVLIGVLRDDRDDVDMVRGALETLVTALSNATQDDHGQLSPGLVNCELLAREQNIVALLLSLLEEEDFYVRYYVLQLLTLLLSVSPARLQEEVLATPQGITRLMDMMLEREVIRNEALLLLTHLTRAAKEIQKIVVFEGAFERVFHIVKEEGGSDGGIVVQDCLELLNNLLRNNSSNQVFLRETMGLANVASLLSLRKGGGDASQQKSVNLLCALETVALLLAGSEDVEPGKDANLAANKKLLAQSDVLSYLLGLSVEGRISAVAIRCLALKCVGDLVNGHAVNRDILANKLVGDEGDAEPAMVCILRVLLRTPNINECIAAEYVIKCFCEGNPDGQTMLASTITPLPQSSRKREDGHHLSFGSMLIQALVGIDGRNDLEASCRAASVLSHILKNNIKCKERVLSIPLEIPSSRLATPELLLPRCMRYLAAASASVRHESVDNVSTAWLQPVILRLLVTWLAECPPAVAAFLETATHLPFLVELMSSSGSPVSVHVAGLAAVLLGECIVYNENKPSPSSSAGTDASAVLEMVNQRIGLTAFFSKWEDMRLSPLFIASSTPTRLPQALTRSTAAAVAAGDGFIAAAASTEEKLELGLHSGDASPEAALPLFYDAPFVQFINLLEPVVRNRIVELFTNPKSGVVTVEVAGWERAEGESESDYTTRLKTVLQTQAQEIQELLARNSALAEDLLINSNEKAIVQDSSTHRSSASLKADVDRLKQQLEESQQKTTAAINQRRELESEVVSYKQLASKYEAELQSLSSAYNELEKINHGMDGQMKSMRSVVEGKGVSLKPSPEELEAAREEGRAEAQKENEAELNDLLVCLGQEESKVEKLRARLEELGEDVGALLEGIGGGDEEDEEDEEEQ